MVIGSTTAKLLNLFARKAPRLLEDMLREAGVEYSKGLIRLRSHIVVDGNLYTGQNPGSSEELANRIVTDVAGAAQR